MPSNYTRRPHLNQKRSLAPIIFLVAVIILGIFGYNFYSSIVNYPSYSPVNSNYVLEVKEGDNLSTVGEKLSKDKAVSQSFSLAFLAQTKPKWNLLPSKYVLKLPASPSQILEQLQVQSEKLASTPGSKAQVSVKITFKEGDTVDAIISKLAQNGVASESQLKTFARDKNAFTQKDFAFLPKPLDCNYGDMQNCAKYYLEGYLYPDTYEFFAPSEPKKIFTKLLSNFDTKVWQKVSSKVTPSTDFAKVVTMASVIERETGRPIEGVSSANVSELNTEKKLMAGTFFNRLKAEMKWQSDPTVVYGTGKSLCQQTLVSQNDCLYLDSPETNNKYNTYKNVGYPIAPTTTPTLGSIEAVLEPTPSDNLFFVSDASGKKYFAKTNEEHEANIAKANVINQQYRK
jgi:UPF0755 protein